MQEAISGIERMITSLIDSNDPADLKRADLMSYWIKTYTRFINKENNFDPTKYISYSRGDVVKLDLGFRIGNEEGGLHYAVVVDNSNSKRSGTLTVIPLSSIRPGRKIHSSSVPIGKEVFTSIVSKHDKLQKEIINQIEKNEKIVDSIIKSDEKASATQIEELKQEIEISKKKLNELNKLKREILKMKKGSVALVSQITTISKIRIYDPIYAHNVLYGIKVTPQALDAINEKLKELFIYM